MHPEVLFELEITNVFDFWYRLRKTSIPLFVILKPLLTSKAQIDFPFL